jgi:putative Holliday junction resolvase
MRALGLDHGDRRIGIAISDDTKTLARPLTVIHASGAAALDAVTTLIGNTLEEDGSLDLVVVGVPRRLDGAPHDRTALVLEFVRQLSARTPLPVVTEDERLSSREAESRLALFEKDWRRRKTMLDAAAAAVILQDYLDRR